MKQVILDDYCFNSDGLPILVQVAKAYSRTVDANPYFEERNLLAQIRDAIKKGQFDSHGADADYVALEPLVVWGSKHGYDIRRSLAPYKPRQALLEGHCDKEWETLTGAQKIEWCEALGPLGMDVRNVDTLWRCYSTGQRERVIDLHDISNCPERNFVGWYDGTMNAHTWFAMPDVSPKYAAMLLCQLDPLKTKDPERVFVDGDETSPERYQLLLAMFESIARAEPKPRTLMDWRGIALNNNLRYHPWVDEYIEITGQGREIAAANEVSQGSAEKVSAGGTAEQAKAKVGRPSDIEKKANITEVIVKACEETLGPFDTRVLPSPKKDFLDACQRIEKTKTNKTTIYGNATSDTVTTWLARRGYRFKNGKPESPTPYTSAAVRIMGKIDDNIFLDI